MDTYLTLPDKKPVEQALTRWIKSLPSEPLLLLERRLNTPTPTLYKNLTDELGVSREKLRRLATWTLDNLSAYSNTEDGAPIKRYTKSVSEASTPAVAANELTQLPEWLSLEFRHIILNLADVKHITFPNQSPEAPDGEWLISNQHKKTDPTKRILQQADPTTGILNPAEVKKQLTEWGLHERFHIAWLSRNNRAGIYYGKLGAAPGSWAAKAVLALTELDRPATSQEIADKISEQFAPPADPYNIASMLPTSDLISRTGAKKWGLSSWGLPVYKGISESLKQLITERGGEVPISEAKQILSDLYGIKPNSVHSNSYSPMFISENGHVRIRSEHDRHYTVRPQRQLRGVYFYFKSGYVAFRMCVTENTLRGSGMGCPSELADGLGITPGEDRVFVGEHGTLRVNWITRSPQANIGSMRKIAVALDAEPGDWLVFRFDVNNGTVTSAKVSPDDIASGPGWDKVAAMIGWTPDTGVTVRAGLEQSLNRDGSFSDLVGLVDALQECGDYAVSHLIPDIA